MAETWRRDGTPTAGTIDRLLKIDRKLYSEVVFLERDRECVEHLELARKEVLKALDRLRDIVLEKKRERTQLQSLRSQARYPR